MSARDPQPGEVFDYTPADRWCREGIAIVDDNRKLRDTYWSSDRPLLSAGEIASAELRFNQNDYRELAESESYDDYAPEDRQSISSQHGLRVRRFVRLGAERDIATQIANAEAALESAKSVAHSAASTVEWRERELAALRAKQVTA